MTHFSSSIRQAAHVVPLLTVFMLSGAATPVSEPGECERLLNELILRYDGYDESGGQEWEPFFPLLDGVKACYGATHSAETAQLANYETSLLFRTGRYEEAIAAFTRFFERDAALADPDVLAKIHQRRGLIYSRTGRPLEALQDYLASTPYVQYLAPGVGSEFYVRIGNRFRTLGDYEGALPYYSLADSLIFAHIDEDPTLVSYRGRVLLSKASLLTDAARRNLISNAVAAQEATPLLEEALTVIPTNDPDFLYERVHTLLRLSEVYRWAGDPSRAFPLIEQARLLSVPGSGRNSTQLSWSYTELGKTQMSVGNFDEARSAFETALAMDREGENPRWVTESLNDLGVLAEVVADTSSIPSYELAMTYYERAIEIADLGRRAFGNLDWSASVFAGALDPYRNLIRLLLREGRAEEAFLRLDETRARYMQDLRFANRLRPMLDADRTEQLDSLEEAQDEARFESLDPEISSARHSELTREIIEIDEEANRLMGFEPVLPAPLSMGALQNVLRSRDQTLLTYFLDDKISFALVVRPDTLVAVELSVGADSLGRLANSLGRAWLDTTTPEPFVDVGVLYELYSELIQPVDNLLEPDQALVIIPEGSLTTLPFAALASHGNSQGYETLEYLGRRHSISMELSAALLTEQRDPSYTVPAFDLLAFGRSDFQEQNSAVPTRASAPLSDLPDVPEELNRLRTLFPAGHFGMNQRASETAFYNSMGSARVLHLASHAIMNPSFPLFSYISLWGGDGNDGTMFLYELQNKSLASDLVVLSGCSTARGQQHLGEGMIGLQHAFRAAGVGGILATMWQVEDRAMTNLMDRFYLHLRAGHRKDRALQLAQLDYLENNSGIRASPFFWASATFYGDPTPVDWQHSSVSNRTWLALGFLLLFAGVALPYMLRRKTNPSG